MRVKPLRQQKNPAQPLSVTPGLLRSIQATHQADRHFTADAIFADRAVERRHLAGSGALCNPEDGGELVIAEGPLDPPQGGDHWVHLSFGLGNCGNRDRLRLHSILCQ